MSSARVLVLALCAACVLGNICPILDPSGNTAPAVANNLHVCPEFNGRLACCTSSQEQLALQLIPSIDSFLNGNNASSVANTINGFNISNFNVNMTDSNCCLKRARLAACTIVCDPNQDVFSDVHQTNGSVDVALNLALQTCSNILDQCEADANTAVNANANTLTGVAASNSATINATINDIINVNPLVSTLTGQTANANTASLLLPLLAAARALPGDVLCLLANGRSVALSQDALKSFGVNTNIGSISGSAVLNINSAPTCAAMRETPARQCAALNVAQVTC